MSKLRFNHMELTLPPGSLAEQRGDIARFYGEIFGFVAHDVVIFDLNALALATDPEASQFILLLESEQNISSPGFDHLGFSYETREEVDQALTKCRAWQARDSRVEIKEYDDLVLPETVTHAFYVKYLLPLWFDVQTIRPVTGFEPRYKWDWVETMGRGKTV